MKKMFVFLLALGLGVFASCDKDDDDSFQPNNNSSVSTKVSKPTIKETARATTTTDLDITFVSGSAFIPCIIEKSSNS